jgi:hypothetical protein
MEVPQMGAPQKGWFIVEHPIISWMISEYPYFRKPPNVPSKDVAVRMVYW